MMVSGEEVEFHVEIRRVLSLCFFGMCKTLLVYDEMVDVDFGGNQQHVGWGKGSIFSLFYKDE